MATQTLTLTICDKCGSDTTESFVSYTVGRVGGGKGRRIDLCPTDAEGFEAYLAGSAPTAPRKRRKAPAKPRGHSPFQVTTVEEIERQKAAQDA